MRLFKLHSAASEAPASQLHFQPSATVTVALPISQAGSGPAGRPGPGPGLAMVRWPARRSEPVGGRARGCRGGVGCPPSQWPMRASPGNLRAVAGPRSTTSASPAGLGRPRAPGRAKRRTAGAAGGCQWLRVRAMLPLMLRLATAYGRPIASPRERRDPAKLRSHLLVVHPYLECAST